MLEAMEIPLRLKYRVGGKSRQKSGSSTSGNSSVKKKKMPRHPNQRDMIMIMPDAYRGKTKMIDI